MSEVLKIEGLAEFRRNLKKISAELPKALRLAGNEAANIIVADAKPKVPLGPGKGGHAKDSIKAASTGTAARIKAGGKKYPYYPWLDFGGKVGRNKSVRRPFLKTGRYIWKSFDDNSEKVRETLEAALIDVARQAGVEVSDS